MTDYDNDNTQIAFKFGLSADSYFMNCVLSSAIDNVAAVNQLEIIVTFKGLAEGRSKSGANKRKVSPIAGVTAEDGEPATKITKSSHSFSKAEDTTMSKDLTHPPPGVNANNVHSHYNLDVVSPSSPKVERDTSCPHGSLVSSLRGTFGIGHGSGKPAYQLPKHPSHVKYTVPAMTGDAGLSISAKPTSTQSVVLGGEDIGGQSRVSKADTEYHSTEVHASPEDADPVYNVSLQRNAPEQTPTYVPGRRAKDLLIDELGNILSLPDLNDIVDSMLSLRTAMPSMDRGANDFSYTAGGAVTCGNAGLANGWPDGEHDASVEPDASTFVVAASAPGQDRDGRSLVSDEAVYDSDPRRPDILEVTQYQTTHSSSGPLDCIPDAGLFYPAMFSSTYGGIQAQGEVADAQGPVDPTWLPGEGKDNQFPFAFDSGLALRAPEIIPSMNFAGSNVPHHHSSYGNEESTVICDSDPEQFTGPTLHSQLQPTVTGSAGVGPSTSALAPSPVSRESFARPNAIFDQSHYTDTSSNPCPFIHYSPSSFNQPRFVRGAFRVINQTPVDSFEYPGPSTFESGRATSSVTEDYGQCARYE